MYTSNNLTADQAAIASKLSSYMGCALSSKPRDARNPVM